MRKLLALGAAAVFSVAAYAEDPVKPDLGAGPHRDTLEHKGGEGKPRRGSEPPKVVRPSGDASTGGSATTPEDANADQLRREDERKATESKEKMKKKPGYKEDVPAPRASK
jgi:hypothetical protein